jgi:hypothetical protein
VSFAAGSAIAVTGIIGGVCLALGLTWLVLAYGQTLGPTLVVIFILVGLLVGGVVALVSAFFGLIMPRQVGGGVPPWMLRELKHWIHHHRRWKNVDWEHWSEEDWKSWADKDRDESEDDWQEPDAQNWTKEDWKAWGERIKEKFKRRRH